MAMNPEKTLTVRLNKNFVGYLEQDLQGKFVFTYDKDNKIPLSLSLPLREEPYLDKECRGFFEGLLPEGEQIRLYIGKKYGINPKNEFSLLKAIGYDCAGAVSFSDYEENPKNIKNDFIKIEGKKFTDKALEDYISDLPLKPLLTNSDGLRLSLAGAQDKMAVVLIDNVVSLPDKDVPTTHILKPEMKDIESSVENEYICLNVAKEIGLNVCNCEIRTTGNIKYLLLERYDRELKGNQVKRIHQEDFCQAKNITSTFKYEREGGINIKDCYEIIRHTKTPALNIIELTNRIIFNYLIGNADAHGKNFSLLYTDTGIQFAPAYDILCTAIYPDLTSNMAMKIGGHYEPDKICEHNWEKMAESVGINYTQLKKMIIEQARILTPTIENFIVTNEIDAPVANNLIKFVRDNCRRVLRRFGLFSD